MKRRSRMCTTDNAKSWSHRIAGISAQIEEMKVWLESQERELVSSLHTQIASLQAELEKLELEIASGSGGVYANHVATQIEALRARGDAVYDLMLRELSQRKQTGSSQAEAT
jgi:DNA-binding FrmR family transcriptional regulator